MALDLNQGLAFNTSSTETLPVFPPATGAFKVIQDDGTLVKVANILSPLDKQMSVKITNTRIANVYNTLAKGTIPLGNQATNTSGQSVFVELSATASKTVGTTEILLPVVARAELRLPNDGDLEEGDIETLLSCLISLFYDQSALLSVTSMMRGALFPAAD